jgi:hypothetical protein
VRGTAALVALVACGGAAKSSSSSSGGTAETIGHPADAPNDAGGAAPRVCLRESKDPMPCSEECERGIAASCVILAQRSHPTFSVRLYERACELRDAPACVSAAKMHATGQGITPNRPKQMELLEKACFLGQAESCSTPARAFSTGNGVPRDERRAHELWERGCGGGIETACDALGDAGP